MAYYRFDTVEEGESVSKSTGCDAARLLQGARVITEPAVSRYLEPGLLEKDAAVYATSGLAKAERDDWTGAFGDFRAANQLVPNSEMRERMVEALGNGRVRAALVPGKGARKREAVHPALASARLDLLQDSPAYVNWANPKAIDLLAPDGLDALSAGADLAGIADLGVGIVVIYDAGKAQVVRKRPSRSRRKALLLKVDPVSSDSTGYTLRSRPEKKVSFYRVREEIEAWCKGTYRVMNTRTGEIISEGTLSASAKDQVDYADYSGKPWDLWIRDGSRLRRAMETEEGFRARRDLISESDLVGDVYEDLRRKLAERVLASIMVW